MEDMVMNAVSNVGFPIAITFYLLVRFQTSMDRFSNKVDELIQEIKKGCHCSH